MGILDVGEKIHIIERRYFENDLRRHFAGEILRVVGNIIRIRGYVWVFNGSKGEFQKRPELRERIIVIGERHTINLITKNTDINNLYYTRLEGSGTVVTDGKDFSLQIHEFTSL
ncbi:hypothetical protein KKF61_00260 [Patescibacteria group bacterium]|nr:hypothetical protein [Patescibacteria group bacterium]MBU0963796.1 hypothetical protein [Patescibacteria group bacterium]